MVLKYICILFILMVGCSSNTNIYENKDSLNYSLVSEKLFYDVKYDFVEVIVKDKVENYNVFVSKKDMSIDFYNSAVTKRIKVMGWKKLNQPMRIRIYTVMMKKMKWQSYILQNKIILRKMAKMGLV